MPQKHGHKYILGVLHQDGNERLLLCCHCTYFQLDKVTGHHCCVSGSSGSAINGPSGQHTFFHGHKNFLVGSPSAIVLTDPKQQFRTTEPRIQIRKKCLWIRNTAGYS
jgi:hypothetical protein